MFTNNTNDILHVVTYSSAHDRYDGDHLSAAFVDEDDATAFVEKNQQKNTGFYWRIHPLGPGEELALDVSLQ